MGVDPSFARSLVPTLQPYTRCLPASDGVATPRLAMRRRHLEGSEAILDEKYDHMAQLVLKCLSPHTAWQDPLGEVTPATSSRGQFSHADRSETSHWHGDLGRYSDRDDGKTAQCCPGLALSPVPVGAEKAGALQTCSPSPDVKDASAPSDWPRAMACVEPVPWGMCHVLGVHWLQSHDLRIANATSVVTVGMDAEVPQVEPQFRAPRPQLIRRHGPSLPMQKFGGDHEQRPSADRAQRASTAYATRPSTARARGTADAMGSDPGSNDALRFRPRSAGTAVGVGASVPVSTGAPKLRPRSAGLAGIKRAQMGLASRSRRQEQTRGAALGPRMSGPRAAGRPRLVVRGTWVSSEVAYAAAGKNFANQPRSQELRQSAKPKDEHEAIAQKPPAPFDEIGPDDIASSLAESSSATSESASPCARGFGANFNPQFTGLLQREAV